MSNRRDRCRTDRPRRRRCARRATSFRSCDPDTHRVADADRHVRPAVLRQVRPGQVAEPRTGHPAAFLRFRDLPAPSAPGPARFVGGGRAQLRPGHRPQADRRAPARPGESLVYDDLLLGRDDRRKLAAVARQHRADLVLVYLDTPPSVIDQRQTENARTRTRHSVPEGEMRLDASLLEPPDAAEQAISVRPGDDLTDVLTRIRARLRPEGHASVLSGTGLAGVGRGGRR